MRGSLFTFEVLNQLLILSTMSKISVNAGWLKSVAARKKIHLSYEEANKELEIFLKNMPKGFWFKFNLFLDTIGLPCSLTSLEFKAKAETLTGKSNFYEKLYWVLFNAEYFRLPEELVEITEEQLSEILNLTNNKQSDTNNL